MTVKRIVALSDVSIGYGTPQIPALMEFLVRHYPGAEGIVLEPDQKQRPPRHGDFPTLRTIRVDTVTPPRSRQWSREFCYEASRFLRRNPADIVLFTSGMNLPVLFSAGVGDAFVIHYGLEMVENQMIDGGEFYLEMNRRAMDRIDLLLFPEENRADIDLRRIGRMPKSTAIVLNCVNNRDAALEFVPPDRRNGRIFYGGELSELTLAQHFFDPRIMGVSIDTFGLVEGPGADKIRQKLADVSAVQHFGYVDAAELKRQRGFYAYSLIAWAPTSDHTRFASPNKFFESIASGVPPICAPHPQCKRIIERYGCGILMDDWSGDALVAAVNRAHALYGTPGYDDLVEACRAAVLAEINWPNQMAKLVPHLPPGGVVPAAEPKVPPSLPARQNDRACVLLGQGRFEAAAEACRLGLLMAPGSPELLRTLAEVHRRGGNAAAAVPVLRLLAQSEPDKAGPELALLLHRLGRPAEARLWLEEARSHAPESPRTLVAEAVLTGDGDAIDRAAARAPDDPDLLAVRAVRLPPAAAMRAFAQLLATDDRHPAALTGIAGLLLDRGDVDSALAHLESLPDGSPEVADLWRRLVDRLLRRRRWDDAFNAACKGLLRFPTHTGLWGMLAGIQERNGDEAGAAESRRRLLELGGASAGEGEGSDGAEGGSPGPCLRGATATGPAGPAAEAEARDAVPPRLPAHLAERFPVLVFPPVDRPAVSVIVPYMDQLALTVRCLQTLLESGDRTPYELILVDDASADDGIHLPLLVKGARHCRNPANLGFGESCNAAARLARAPLLLFLNNDTLVRPGWLDALVATFGQHPGAGVVGAKLLNPDGTLQEAGAALFRDGSATQIGRGDDPGRPEYNFVRPVDYASGAALAVKADLFAALGGFDPLYAPAYCEDVDLALGARAQGAEVLYQPLSEVVHLEGGTAGTDTAHGVKAFQPRNMRRLARKWADALRSHPLPGERPALRRATAGRNVLLLCSALPGSGPDDDGSPVLERVRDLLGAGWGVTLVATARLRQECAEATEPEAGRHARVLGAEVLNAPYYTSVEDVLRRRGEEFPLVLVFGSGLLDEHAQCLAHHAPGTRILLDVTGDPAADRRIAAADAVITGNPGEAGRLRAQFPKTRIVHVPPAADPRPAPADAAGCADAAVAVLPSRSEGRGALLDLLDLMASAEPVMPPQMANAC